MQAILPARGRALRYRPGGGGIARVAAAARGWRATAARGWSLQLAP